MGTTITLLILCAGIFGFMGYSIGKNYTEKARLKNYGEGYHDGYTDASTK